MRSHQGRTECKIQTQRQAEMKRHSKQREKQTEHVFTSRYSDLIYNKINVLNFTSACTVCYKLALSFMIFKPKGQVQEP